MKEKSLDFIIAKAEEKRRQQSGEPAREPEKGHGNLFFGSSRTDSDNQHR